jgi:CRISPR system Cascade subunit CasA
MSDIQFDLLDEALIGVETNGCPLTQTLPEVMTGLARGQELVFSALQPHQHLAWYAFLVQLGALALNQGGMTITDDFDWHAGLLRLSGGQHEPWCLIVKDLALPALLQPPIPERLVKWTSMATEPDDLDVLVASKNHDLKLYRMAQARPEHWLYALVNLQTTQGFLGSGNYGIARMNGGFSSRPMVGFMPSADWSQRFRRDVTVLLASRARLVEEYGFRAVGGLGLLWLEPWDGAKSLALEACDPFFIEICRRTRLEPGPTGVGIVSRASTSAVYRITQGEDGNKLTGNVGDPWMPIKKAKGTALTVSGKGFDFELVQELLFGGDYRAGVAQELSAGDGNSPIFLAQVLVRGQGKTEGIHRREVIVPPKARKMLGKPEERSRLGLLAKHRVELAGKAQALLRLPLHILMQGDPPKVDFKAKDGSDRWVRRFTREVDSIFFDAFWEALESERPEEAMDAAWTHQLLALAGSILTEATGSVPIAGAHRYRILASVERAFQGSKKKAFPELIPFSSKGVLAHDGAQ